MIEVLHGLRGGTTDPDILFGEASAFVFGGISGAPALVDHGGHESSGEWIVEHAGSHGVLRREVVILGAGCAQRGHGLGLDARGLELVHVVLGDRFKVLGSGRFARV